MATKSGWVTVLVGLALAASGCGIGMQTVRHYAVQDLRCPSGSIRTTALPDGAYRAEGCGRRAYYLDDNAFAPGAQTTSNAVYWQRADRTSTR